MRDIAIALGFDYSHRGCSCSGSPYVYTATRDGKRYELTIYESRDLWILTVSNTRIAEGNEAELKTKIKEIWDL